MLLKLEFFFPKIELKVKKKNSGKKSNITLETLENQSH